jgi:hypothetical protein
LDDRNGHNFVDSRRDLHLASAILNVFGWECLDTLAGYSAF